MKFAKSILMGTGSVVLAGLILALLAPKAAHAIAATAVQVMNTTATPVPNKDVDQPGRKAFHQTCISTTSSCTLSPAVPAGYQFVIQTLYAEVSFSTAQTEPPPMYFSATSTGDILTYYFNSTLNAAGNHGKVLLTATIYEDPLSPPPEVTIGGPAAGVLVYFIGYLISTP